MPDLIERLEDPEVCIDAIDDAISEILRCRTQMKFLEIRDWIFLELKRGVEIEDETLHIWASHFNVPISLIAKATKEAQIFFT